MKKSITMLLVIVSLFISCKKEDSIPPVINSVNIQIGDTLRNNFEIKVDATDNSGVSAIEVYANDSLIIKDTKSSLDFSLNTLAMKDGEYTIKTVAYDAKGNKTESSNKVQISNALLTFNLGNSNHSPFPLVISDEQGNILRSISLQGSGKVKIMPQAVYEKNGINLMFSLTNSGFTGIMAYIHVKRGSEFNQGWNNSVAPVLKGIKLHLKNDIGSFSQIRISTDWASYQLLSMADTINLPSSIPYSTDHKLLLQLKTDNGQYYKIFTIENVQELTENLSDINKPESLKTLASGGIAFLYLEGIAHDPDSINRYNISEYRNEVPADHLDINYPAEYFLKYHSYISFNTARSGDNYLFYHNYYRGEIPGTSVPLSANFEIINSSPNNFSSSISGTFDYYSIAYYDPTQTIELGVSAPLNQKEWKLPDLATVFGNTAYTNFTWNSVELVNMGSLDWSTKYYDTNTGLEKLNFYESFSQDEWIYPASKYNIQIRPGQDLITDMMRRLGMK